MLAGCGYDATPIPQAVVPEPAAPAAVVPCDDTGDPTRSYAPAAGGLPAPGRPAAAARRWPRSATAASCSAGVSGDSYLLGSRNPFTGVIEGFDIDMVNQIAAAIFGTAKGHVQLRVISAADRIPLLQADEIDIVARNMTINCTRWDQIAFSAEYFHSGQKILVAEGLRHRRGSRTCPASAPAPRPAPPASTTSRRSRPTPSRSRPATTPAAC